MREQMLDEKMKGFSGGFPTMLQLLKPEKENCMEFREHEGSSQQDICYIKTQHNIQNKFSTQSYRNS